MVSTPYDPLGWSGNDGKELSVSAREIYQTAVNFGPEIKEILIRQMHTVAKRWTDDGSKLPNVANDAYLNDPHFRAYVDQAFDGIITLLAVKRMTE